MMSNTNSNPLSEAISRAYDQIKGEVNVKLNSQGYTIVHEEHNDEAFGSRYIVWSNNVDALRFIWDDKEGYFVLEVADTLPLSIKTAWDEMLLMHYDPKIHDIHYVVTIATKFVDSLK